MPCISANLERKWKSHSEGNKIGRIDAAAGHKSAQKGGKALAQMGLYRGYF